MIKSIHTRDLAIQSDSLAELLKVAKARVEQGFAPPAEIYRIQHRSRIDWSAFPDWARPVDPEMFDGCCHEG